jgi:hypothetical protein
VLEAFCEGMSVGAVFYRNFQTYFSGLARMVIYFYGSPYSDWRMCLQFK